MANLVGERWRVCQFTKISAVILGVCGCITLVLSFAQLRMQFYLFFVQRRVLDRSLKPFCKTRRRIPENRTP